MALWSKVLLADFHQELPEFQNFTLPSLPRGKKDYGILLLEIFDTNKFKLSSFISKKCLYCTQAE
ncbi:MAG: hypothetical protein ACE5KT_03560 [Methanosarcinales archaeon]